MSGYIGNIPVPQATQSREVFTATSGQTTFATVGYPVGFCDVWLNGVKLINGTDFTATNGSDVVLTVGATTGDTVEVISNSTFEVNSQTFTGTTTLTGDLQATTATFSGAVTGTNITLSGGVYLGGTGAANLLDDYETGAWTPVVTTSNGDLTGAVMQYNSGTYTKVGDAVHFRFGFKMNGLTSAGTGEWQINGLPFASKNYGAYQEPTFACKLGVITNTATAQAGVFAFPIGNSTVLRFRVISNADSPVQANEWTSQTFLSCTGTYYTLS